MSIRELSSQEIDAVVGTRHSGTGIAYLPEGLQPYYAWLIRTLHLLAESSAGALRVARDGESEVAVRVAPGRASISEVALMYEGGTIDLGAHNNDTVYLSLRDEAGSAAIAVASQGEGWPTAAHIKLAEVTLEGGEVVEILDRRFETIFRV